MPKLKINVKNKTKSKAYHSADIANLVLTNSTDAFITYLNNVISYSIVIKNSGTSAVSNVIIKDPLTCGTVLIPNSMIVSVPYTPLPGGAIALSYPINTGEFIIINFKVLVTSMPSPNPILNQATADYTFCQTIAACKSNTVTTAVFRYNFSQHISDLIESATLEQADFAAIASSESTKIQRMAAMPDITPHQLLCLNKCLNEMMDSITLLETVLRQKESAANGKNNDTIC